MSVRRKHGNSIPSRHHTPSSPIALCFALSVLPRTERLPSNGLHERGSSSAQECSRVSSASQMHEPIRQVASNDRLATCVVGHGQWRSWA